jgi:drug/metabolite transporter (DMT)-like permease
MRPLDWLLLVILSVLWGATFYFAAIALRELPPFTLVLARCAVAAMVLIPLVLAMGLKFPATRKGWQDFVMMAILNNIMPFSLIFYAQTTISGGLASVLNASAPLFALIVASVFAGEKLGWNKLAGILIGITGVAILIGPEAIAGKPASVLAMCAVIGATLCYGLSSIWGRRLVTYPAVVSAASQMICSTLLLLVIAGSVDRFWRLPIPSQATLLAVLGVGILSTALAYVIFFRIMASAGPTNVMLVTLLIPFSSILLGTLLLGEHLELRQIVGALIIGSGLLVIDGRMFGIRPASPAQTRTSR